MEHAARMMVTEANVMCDKTYEAFSLIASQTHGAYSSHDIIINMSVCVGMHRALARMALKALGARSSHDGIII